MRPEGTATGCLLPERHGLHLPGPFGPVLLPAGEP